MKRAVLFAAVTTGAVALSAQIVLMRELLIAFYGNELSVAFILAAWLIAGACGALVFGRLADRIRRKAELLITLQLILAALLPATIVAIRSVKTLWAVQTGEIVPVSYMALASPAILFPLCSILGFAFALMSRIYGPEESHGALKTGTVYAFEAVGALFGGCITSFILIRALDPVEVAALLGTALSVCALIMAGELSEDEGRRRLRGRALIIIIAWVVLWLGGSWKSLQAESLARQWRGQDLVASDNSIYGNMVLARSGSQWSFFENGLHLYTVPDRAGSEESVHYALLEHPGPKNVLLIGGGVGGLLREILKHPIERVDYIELDPLMVKMAREHLPDVYSAALDDRRTALIYEDGRRYVKTAKRVYDAVIVCLGDPYTAQLNRFYTVEFYAEVKNILRSGGILSFGLASSESYIGRENREYLGSIYATLKRVFEGVKVIPGETAYFLASDRPSALTYDYGLLMKRAADRKVELAYVREYYLSSKLSPALIDYTEKAIGTASGKINTDLRPTSYYYDIIFWAARFRGSLLAPILKKINGVSVGAGAVAACAALLGVGVLGMTGRPSPRRIAYLATGVNGLSQMSLQVTTLLAFQAIYGYMFQMLGLIMTAFMAGLAAGGLCAIRKLSVRPERAGHLMMILMACLAAYPLLLMAALGVASSSILSHARSMVINSVFFVLPAVAGFLGGYLFPVVNRICLTNESLRGRVAGMTYGADLAGSCIGALITGTLLIPIVGMQGTCCIVAGLNAALFAALAITQPRGEIKL